METLVKLAAIAACFAGLNASKASAEFPRGDRNDIWVLDTGAGYSEVEWTYLMMLDLGLTEYEAMVLLGDDAIAIPVSSISLPGIPWPIESISAPDAEPKPTKIERPVFGPHFKSSPFVSANDGSANIGGSAGPGGTTYLTANIAGCVPNTD